MLEKMNARVIQQPLIDLLSGRSQYLLGPARRHESSFWRTKLRLNVEPQSSFILSSTLFLGISLHVLRTPGCLPKKNVPLTIIFWRHHNWQTHVYPFQIYSRSQRKPHNAPWLDHTRLSNQSIAFKSKTAKKLHRIIFSTMRGWLELWAIGWTLPPPYPWSSPWGDSGSESESDRCNIKCWSSPMNRELFNL